MRAIARVAFALALFAAPPARADRETCRFTEAELSADLDELERTINEHWAWRELRRFDVAAAIRAVRRQLAPETDGETFRALLRGLVASMKDGHGSARLPCVREPEPRRWPFTIVDASDGIIIDQPDASAGGLARGDRLLAVDDVPIERRITELERSTAASTPGQRRALALRSLVYTPALGITARIRRDGKTRIVPLSTLRWYTQTPETVESRPLGDGVGYVRIRSFLPDDLAQLWDPDLTEAERERLAAPWLARIDAAFDAVADSRALVIDLRGNLGGTDMLAQRVSDHLIAGRYIYYRLASQQKGWWGPPYEYLVPRAKVTPFSGRVAVLIDELTMSAADDVTRCLRDLRGDLAFVGRPTAAATGAPRDFTLTRTGAIVSFATLRVYGPKGNPLEGHSVEPDVPTQPRREDVVHGVDVDLAAALDALHWRPDR